MHQEKTISTSKGFVWYFNNSNLGKLAAISEKENSAKELIENFNYQIGDYVQHKKMWSNQVFGWILVEVYKNNQLLHRFDFDNEVRKSILDTQKRNQLADNQIKEFREKQNIN